MKNGIPDNIYYELLEWKDKNLLAFNKFTELISYLNDKKRVYSLNELTPEELKVLYFCIHMKQMPVGQDGGEEFKLSHS